MNLPSQSHRRWNPLREEWILVSPHRGRRPWSGALEVVEREDKPEYDPTCYLCPGNTRVNGEKNPNYESVYTFDNDFPALIQDQIREEVSKPAFIRARSERGICRVLCFSPRHDLTLAEMSDPEIEKVVDLWNEQYQDLLAKSFISHVMIFENKGKAMGCSNMHPHGQIWATETIPNIPLRSLQSQAAYFKSHGLSLLEDYGRWEIEQGERIVAANEHWLAVVPFWAQWPFETLLFPRRHVGSIPELSAEERSAWASIISEVTVRYDNLFSTSFPYSMGIYQRVAEEHDYTGTHLYQIFLPPLLRSATIRKFMVGYELCAEPQRDITAESAAARLREMSTTHYLKAEANG